MNIRVEVKTDSLDFTIESPCRFNIGDLLDSTFIPEPLLSELRQQSKSMEKLKVVEVWFEKDEENNLRQCVSTEIDD
jgi:hypothetical protein